VELLVNRTNDLLENSPILSPTQDGNCADTTVVIETQNLLEISSDQQKPATGDTSATGDTKPNDESCTKNDLTDEVVDIPDNQNLPDAQSLPQNTYSIPDAEAREVPEGQSQMEITENPSSGQENQSIDASIQFLIDNRSLLSIGQLFQINDVFVHELKRRMC